MNSINKDLTNVIKLWEEQKSPLIDKDAWRLSFHLMPPIGWLNDPNGLCYFRGVYHVFFQYSPFNSSGGMKFWGHYTSSDLITWTYEGVPLLPDEKFDCHGVYSGSAFTEDDIMYLYYTGNVKQNGDYDYIYNGREANTICVESTDGVNFGNKQLIMDHNDYPSDLSCHVRDPKVFQYDDMYYMVQGARDKEDIGQIILFVSSDKKHWNVKNIIKSKKAFGYMWECPDLFILDRHMILLLSPQGVKAEGIQYQNVYQSGYYLIDGDFRSDYELSSFTELDHGFDFYAPQTFQDHRGRRILIGWMGMPDCDEQYNNPTVIKGWQHGLTIPRVLNIKNGILYQTPIEELKLLRQNPLVLEVKNQTTIADKKIFELKLDIKSFTDDVFIYIKGGISLLYESKCGLFHLKFSNHVGSGRIQRSAAITELKNIHIFCDTSSLEVFINDGQTVFTTRYYMQPSESVSDIQISGGNLHAKGVLWELKPMDIIHDK